jgi:hypothetical protein
MRDRMRRRMRVETPAMLGLMTVMLVVEMMRVSAGTTRVEETMLEPVETPAMPGLKTVMRE